MGNKAVHEVLCDLVHFFCLHCLCPQPQVVWADEEMLVVWTDEGMQVIWTGEGMLVVWTDEGMQGVWADEGCWWCGQVRDAGGVDRWGDGQVRGCRVCGLVRR